MSDLKERFSPLRDDLDRLDPLEMWDAIQHRAAAAEPEAAARSSQRLIVIGVALALAVLGFLLVLRAFNGADRPRPASPTVRNGSLSFLGGDFTGWLVQPDGSGLHEIVRPSDVAYLVPWRWSPDGSRLAMYGYLKGHGGDYAIFVANADGTGVTDLTSRLFAAQGENNQGNPQWSPDSTMIAFENDSNDRSLVGVYVMASDGLGVHKVGDGGNPSWSPDGSRIVFVGPGDGGKTDIFSVRPDGSGLLNLTQTPGVGEQQPQWSPDGSSISYLAVVHGQQELFVMGPDGSNARAVTPMDGSSYEWSPDGSRMAFEDIRNGHSDIALVNVDGSARTYLTDTPGDENSPVWAPDGSAIAFVATPIPAPGSGDGTGTVDIYTIRADGSGERRVTSGAGAAQGALTWQPVLTPSTMSPSPAPVPDIGTVPEVTVTRGVTLDFAPKEGLVSAEEGFGSLWVLSITSQGEWLLVRADPQTGTVEHSFHPADTTAGQWGGGGIVLGGGYVWVPGVVRGQGATLLRIDPTTNALDVIDLPAATVAWLGFDADGHLWANLGLGRQGQEVAELDPTTGVILSAWPFQADWSLDLCLSLGSAWVHEAKVKGSDVLGGSLVQIVPGNAAPVDIGGTFAKPVCDAEGMWTPFHGSERAMNMADGIARIDPVTGEVLNSWSTDPIGYDFTRGTDGGVWFLTTGGTLERLNPSTGRIDVREQPDGTPLFIVSTPGPIWVGTYEGKLIRYDVSSN